MKSKVAILGLGTMGCGMAKNLLSAGFSVIVFNRTRSKAESFAALGARVGESPAHAVNDADVIITMLADENASRATWTGPAGALSNSKSGAILVESSTVTPKWIAELQGLARAKGLRLLDAPGTYATCAPPVASGATLSSSAGLTLSSRYLVGPGGEQVTELNGSATWQHSNIWAGGKLLATYDLKGIHFQFTDPLGSKRVQANAAGQIDEQCTSLPFGNDLNNPPNLVGSSCIAVANPLGTSDDATEHHFTSRERDTETGNDYLLARYYTSALGRFITPDWSAQVEPVPYAKLDDPQSLNLYAYVRNNPLASIDPDGHGCEKASGSSSPECIAQATENKVFGEGRCASGNCAEPSAQQQAQGAAQQQNGSSKGTSFWHGLSNLFHGHSWNYVKATVTDTETYTLVGILYPGADAAAQAAKAKVTNPGSPTPPPVPRPVPGPDPVPPQLPPGEVPEIEPGASTLQKLGVAALNIVKQLGNTPSDVIVCATCNYHYDPMTHKMVSNDQVY